MNPTSFIKSSSTCIFNEKNVRDLNLEINSLLIRFWISAHTKFIPNKYGHKQHFFKIMITTITIIIKIILKSIHMYDDSGHFVQ